MDLEYTMLEVISSGLALQPSIKYCYKGHHTLRKMISLLETNLIIMKYDTDIFGWQVVIAMRDLFQVVFELKKKEIEMAKQHLSQHQIRLGGSLFLESGSNSKVSLAAQIVSFAQPDYIVSYDVLVPCVSE
jgi:hypothetical protein